MAEVLSVFHQAKEFQVQFLKRRQPLATNHRLYYPLSRLENKYFLSFQLVLLTDFGSSVLFCDRTLFFRLFPSYLFSKNKKVRPERRTEKVFASSQPHEYTHARVEETLFTKSIFSYVALYSIRVVAFILTHFFIFVKGNKYIVIRFYHNFADSPGGLSLQRFYMEIDKIKKSG